MNLEMKSGGKIILETGSVISFGDNSLEIRLEMFNPPQPILVFSFESKEGLNQPEAETTINEDKSKLEIKLFNVDSALDVGNIEPIKIGHKDNKTIFLNYRVRKIGESRTIDYTFYSDL